MVSVDMVIVRAGARCELCRTDFHPHGWSRHHRQPRGMGGTKRDVHGPENMLLLCGSGTSGCHGWVESNRALAYDLGYLVRRPTDPADVPVLLGYRWSPSAARWVLLRRDGTTEPVDSPPRVPLPGKE